MDRGATSPATGTSLCPFVLTSLASGVLRKGKNATSTLWVASASEPGSAHPLTSGQAKDTRPA
ncbi:hypothetical protein N7467_009500 [Penicillium canescens]|nr:hypothetical protein N7467_009500 [Penicillium canescens]